MAAFWGVRIHFGDNSVRILQSFLLAVGLVASLATIAFALLAIRKSGPGRPSGVPFLAAGLLLAVLAFAIVYAVGASH
jgi:hypothetical protein